MGRMIINYSDDIPTEAVPLYIKAVVDCGRQSGDGKCYCYLSIFKDDTVCEADVTKSGTDVFRLYKEQDK